MLFSYLDKVNRTPSEIRREDVDAVKATGWSEEAIYDAINVCGLFNFYNRWIDATGVGHHPPEFYKFSAERLAQGGYADPSPAGAGGPKG